SQWGAVYGAGEEESDGVDRGPGEVGSFGYGVRRRPAAHVLAEPGSVPNTGTREGAPHPDQDAGKAGERRSGGKGQGGRHSEADQGGWRFRQTGEGEFRGYGLGSQRRRSGRLDHAWPDGAG